MTNLSSASSKRRKCRLSTFKQRQVNELQQRPRKGIMETRVL
jgi:hypothetical protein